MGTSMKLPSLFKKRPENHLAEDEVLKLVWSALDGEADHESMSRLQELVKDQHQARQAFRDAVDMERSLQLMFSGGSAPQCQG